MATVIAKVEQWQNDERNARFREHGGDIGHRQRLPEQNAAVAAFAVQRVETIKHTHDDTGEHHQTCRHVVRRLRCAPD